MYLPTHAASRILLLTPSSFDEKVEHDQEKKKRALLLREEGYSAAAPQNT
jgi:hypothetical protein